MPSPPPGVNSTLQGTGVEQLAQRSCRATGVLGLRYRPQDHGTPGTRVDHLAEVASVQAADRKERHRGVLGRVSDQLQADGGAARLGRGFVHGTYAYVVGLRRIRGVDLLRGVGRQADQHIRADQLANLVNRHVVLPDVHAVGPRLHGDRRSVVDDEEGPQPLAKRASGVGHRDEPVVAQVLLAQLYDLNAPGHCCSQEVRKLAPVGTRLIGVRLGRPIGHRPAHEVQPRGAKSRPPLGAGVSHGHGPKSDTGLASGCMPRHRSSPDVLVLGGGVIGLSVAWRARQRGMSVTVLERDATGQGSSRVAAGMLAPVAEAEFGEAGRRLLELGLRSAEIWPAFAADLQAVTGREVGLMKTGTLLLARDEDEARELERQIAFRDSLGLRTERLRPSEAREREPALAPTVRLALEAPEDNSVDPRLVLAALRSACESTGVVLREHARVARIESDGAGAGSPPTRVTGVTLGSEEAEGRHCGHGGGREGTGAKGGNAYEFVAKGGDPFEFVAAGAVVVAAGAWVEQIEGLPGDARVPVRPVKGQILRLRDPAGPGLLERVVRFRGGYLVPRADGRYVLGATVEERGFELAPTVGGVYELLRDAHELVPGVSELEIEELCVGLRPGTPDNVPAIGPGALAGLIWATGHHRNGILLAPLTAELVVETLVEGQPANPLLDACAPARFTAESRRPRSTDAAPAKVVVS